MQVRRDEKNNIPQPDFGFGVRDNHTHEESFASGKNASCTMLAFAQSCSHPNIARGCTAPNGTLLVQCLSRNALLVHLRQHLEPKPAYTSTNLRASAHSGTSCYYRIGITPLCSVSSSYGEVSGRGGKSIARSECEEQS